MTVSVDGFPTAGGIVEGLLVDLAAADLIDDSGR
jgi:hypothetical protein